MHIDDRGRLDIDRSRLHIDHLLGLDVHLLRLLIHDLLWLDIHRLRLDIHLLYICRLGIDRLRNNRGRSNCGYSCANPKCTIVVAGSPITVILPAMAGIVLSAAISAEAPPTATALRTPSMVS